MNKGMKFLAIALAAAMIPSSMTAYAAPKDGSSYTNYGYTGRSLLEDFWKKITRGSGSGSGSGSESNSDASLTLIEDETTVEEGTELRASTYALSSSSTPSAQSDSTTLKYFPVTLYDYDKTTINNATHQVEVNNGQVSTWNGIYFSNGAPAAESYTYSTTGGYTYSSTTVRYDSWGNYSKYTNGGYYVDVNGIKYEVTNITSSWSVRSGYQWTITYNGGSTTSSNATITLYTRTASGTTTTGSLSYAAWNWWSKNDSDSTKNTGDMIYTGLVESSLDANKNIVFTKLEGGIFNSDSSVKEIYTNVEMPFTYDSTTHTYSFDSSKNGVYFYTDSVQGSTTAQSNGRLYFNAGNTQSNGVDYGDGSKTIWMPFNSTTSINGEDYCNYHFGMAATIPFTMTADGKLVEGDANSDDIVFSFSGDDDVWVFIDGQLVIDLGGIHNRLDATINFANNTVVYSEDNTADENYETGSYNDSAFKTTQTLFGNLISSNITTFAAKDSHELTIYYLERGAGSSNCKIEFNLPMKDTVSVRKQITQSATVDASGNVTYSSLTAAEQATIDQMDFGFTLYAQAGDETTAVANATYNLLNANGQVISTPSTDANGRFNLKNEQTAKFVVDLDSTVTYYVVETEKDGFVAPTFSYNAEAANGATETASSQQWQSMLVTVTGSSEAEDSITIVCENYMDNELSNPGVLTGDDAIVIDYGLPVVIDVLSNDVYRGESIEVIKVTEGQYGKAEIQADGTIKYQLTEQLSGVEKLTYTVEVTGTSTTNVGGTVNTPTASGEGTVYIIPATSMYYEENFSDMVTFTGSWSDVGTAQTDPQEPGVVGTVGDSPYGSDAAYLNDGGDSNGSSKYVDTTNGAASFSYTFTGEGTSFFARTSGTAAYMRVVITDKDGNTVYTGYRNNIYKSVEETDVGTLYNVPVFTYETDNYGTYTVTVSIAQANNNLNRGEDFYLDGIRVINPLGEDDANASVAKAAYATDGEANMTVVTLREKLIAEAQLNEDNTISWNEGDNFVLFTDNNGTITAAEEYKSNGPKEEVYLNNGQSVTFSLKDWDANTNKIYLGVKAPLGSGSVSINGNTLNLSNAADCYYDISSYADITTGEDGTKVATFEIKATSSLVSVTNIKVTGNAEFTIVNAVEVTASLSLQLEENGITVSDGDNSTFVVSGGDNADSVEEEAQEAGEEVE